MPRAKKAQRIFKYDGRDKKPDFNVTTTLTDAEAIEFLGGYDGDDFSNKCAFEIHKHSNGFLSRDNMVAWGFKLAEEAANPPAGVTLGQTVLAMVRFRKPLKGCVEGETFKVSLAGENSRHRGNYIITDGGPYGSNRFYGYAKPDGTWSPRTITPESVIATLTK